MGQHYKLGFHLGPGGNPTGIGAWMQKLDVAAIPFFLKSVDHYGPCFEAMQYTKADHTVVFRLSKMGQGTGYDFDVPDYSLTPLAAAVKHWTQMKLRLPPEFDRRVWLEPINEVDKDRSDWLGRFAVEIATIANEEGYRVALFAWSAGEPEESHWETPGMVAYLKRCGMRPQDCAVALHEYSYNKANIKDGWPYKIGRFAQLFRVCDRLGIVRPKVLITEWGWEYESVPDVAPAMVDMAWMADVYATYPDILGAAIWYLGPGFGNIANQVQRLIQPAGDAAVAYRYMVPELPTTFPPPTGPANPPPPTLPPVGVPVARVKYTRFTVLIHPTDGKPFADAVTAATWKAGDPNLPHFFTVGASADDAGVAVLYELPDHSLAPIPRYVIAVNPERWGPGDDGRGLAGFFETYYAGVNYVPVAAATPEALRLLLENFDPANPPAPTPPLITLPVDALNQRDARWASVVMGTNSQGEIETIGSWGCLVSAYAMQANQFGVASYNPAEMWAYMKAKGATSGPNLNPAALRTAFPDKVKYLGYQTGGANLPDRIRAHIDAGYTVPGRVDHNPATGQTEQHWILVDGYERDSGRIHMTDPWTGKKQFVDEVYDINGNDVLEALFYELLTELPPPPPAPTPTYKYNGPAVVFSPALHQPASDWEWARPQSQEQFTKTGLPVKWMSDGVNANYWGLFNKPAYHLVRIMWKPDRKKSPAEAWADVKDGVLRFYNKGARRFELHNELNLPEEGWGTVWTTAQEAGTWLREWALIIRQACPLAKLYFPGLSPGVPWTNQFTVSVGAWAICKDLMSGFAMHAYTGITTDEVAAANELVHQVKELQRFMNLQVPLSVSELSVNRAASAAYKVAVYKRVENALRVVPGVEAVCYYISSWEQVPTSQAPHQESWAKHGIGDAYAALAG